jgi:hypothetical protein
MNNTQKGIMYGRLMNEHTKLQNKVSEIQGSSINLNKEQLREIEELKRKMAYIFNQVSRL